MNKEIQCFDYDKKNDILFIRWKNTKYKVSEEIDDGNIVLDLDESGQIIGVEIFSIMQKLKSSHNATRKEKTQ